MPPLPVGRSVVCCGCTDVGPALEELGLDVQHAADWDSALALLHEPGVRALIMKAPGKLSPSGSKAPPPAAQGRDGQLMARQIAQARQEAPLTEVFVWAPGGGVEVVRRALQEGAADVALQTSPYALARAVLRAIDRQRFLPRMQRFRLARSSSSRFEGLVSRSPALWELFETVVQIAPSGASVLVLGETGVGKELLARAIHRQSGREGRFVALNCGSLPEALVEAELFGHEEGTFTGATKNRLGLFRSAEGGTLFLDEIGNLPLAGQHSLLRALQEEAVRPVGGSREIPLDVRVVAATSVPLDALISAGGFRQDLLFRLDVIRLVVPPLRERPEDVVHLFGYFRRRHARRYRLEPPQANDDFLDALLAYHWPGNVRELGNLVERLVLTHHGKPISRRHFDKLKRESAPAIAQPERRAPARTQPAARGRAAAADWASEDPSSTLAEVLAETERRYLIAALSRNRGRIDATAQAAGLSPRTLLRKLTKHAIDKNAYKGPRRDSSALQD